MDRDMRQTLAIETIPGKKGVWLVALNIKGESLRLAKFVNQQTADLYLKLMTGQINQAYTSGQMGI